MDAEQGPIWAALGEIFQDVFGREVELRPETTARDVAGWDSLKQIEIIVGVEQCYGVKFRVRELDAIATVGDLVGLIAARR